MRVMEAFVDGLMTVYRWPRMIRDALYVDLCETEHCPAGFLSGGYSSAPSEALLSAEPPTDFVSSGPPPGVGWRSTSSSISGSEAREARDQTQIARCGGMVPNNGMTTSLARSTGRTWVVLIDGRGGA